MDTKRTDLEQPVAIPPEQTPAEREEEEGWLVRLAEKAKTHRGLTEVRSAKTVGGSFFRIRNIARAPRVREGGSA